MGLSIGIICDRCGEQISYSNTPFKTRKGGDGEDICGKCLKEINKKKWDEEHETDEIKL